MATIFKTISSNDITSTKTLLNESVPVTGTLLSSSTYADNNIKEYAHGMFQSVYDYPYLSSSANHLMDLSVGYYTGSALNNSANSQNSKKVNVYGQMAQVLAGHESDGTIRAFDTDGDLAGGTKMNEAYFINMSRLLVKDEIKKGSFSMVLGSNTAYGTPFGPTITVADTGAATSHKVNSPAGEYGLLYTGSVSGTPVGHLYYQAGVAVLTASIFGAAEMDASANTSEILLTGSVINDNADAIRHRVQNIQFENVIELNSTIYFCNANHNEFNYSANPTYLSGSEIIVKGGESAQNPSAYITSVGLYSADNELLATAKLSEPLKKDPSNSLTLRVRLDY
jgi:hypothetical protein